MQGIQSVGVAATAKHFPGHGYVKEDSHLKLQVDRRSPDAIINGSRPFREAIGSDVKSVMVSHVQFEEPDPDFPASLSKRIMGYLRRDLGFQNVIITDSLDMKAVAANFSVSEFTELAYDGGADILECADPELAIDIFEKLESMHRDEGGKKRSRVTNLTCPVASSFTPPREIMNWISAQAIKWLRQKSLDPKVPFVIIPLCKKGDKGKWPYSMHARLNAHLKELGIENEIIYLDDDLNFKGKNVVFIGKNLHLSDSWKKMNGLAASNNCCFNSTGVPADSGVLDDKIGCIPS